MSNDMRAAAEYANRPEDERFPTYAALVQHAEYVRSHSAERTYNLRDLNVTNHGGRAVLESPKGIATFTPWSFSQLCSTVGAPAKYLRSLPPANVVADLNYGLHENPDTAGKRANVLVQANGGTPIVRAATSDTYVRCWDADLHGVGQRYFGDGCRSSQGEWMSPPTWDGRPAGQYYGDRDSFVIRVDGGSLVTDPRGWGALGSSGGQGGGQLNRGILIRNSEVGASSIYLDCILFDKICGNHILWGAVIDRTFRRRHVGSDLAQKAVSEILSIARKYNQRTASEDEKIIRSLTQYEIASSKDAVIDELRKLGYTKEAATEAYTTCEAKDPSLNPRSFWGIAAGTTRNSQDTGYQDERLQLDQLAAAVLKKGRALVTV